MLVMQVLNKVVTEHRYPFSSFMLQNNFINIVAELSNLRSKLLDTEILKFYKALHRSKDQSYLDKLKRSDLFMPVFSIFKRCYASETPGLVLSVCRDLFEQIFRKSLGVAKNPQPNCFHDQRFVDYLTVQHVPSKEVLFDDRYAEIFKKYNLKRPDYHEFFLDNKAPSREDNSFSGPSSICSDIGLNRMASIDRDFKD